MIPVVLLFILLAAPLDAQQSTPAQAPAAQPYTDDEFAPWVLELRRAEVIAVGAFPIAYLFAGLGYDYAFYFSSGSPQEEIPWPLGPGTSQWTQSAEPTRLQKKNLTLVAVSVGLSLAVAALDWWLGL